MNQENWVEFKTQAATLLPSGVDESQLPLFPFCCIIRHMCVLAIANDFAVHLDLAHQQQMDTINLSAAIEITHLK